MNSSVLIESFADFATLRKIDRPTMIKILEDVFRTMIRKKFGTDENFDVVINLDKGDLEIYRYRQIVEDKAQNFDATRQIRLKDARKIDASFQVGEEVVEPVQLSDFGRRLVQTARQTLIQKVKDVEKDNLYNKYRDKVGEIVTVEVYQIVGKDYICIDNEKNELFLPFSETIQKKDRFRKGDTLRAVVHKVETINGTPKITLSRTSPVFLERLFELEVPEIAEGIIAIKRVERDPGERAKVAVESFDDRIDPVGACVGMKGSRIHSIVRELQNENIDVINYTENFELYVARALAPAKLNSIKVDEKRRRVMVTLDRDQVSLAIGKNGSNIKLASRLIGMEIDIFRELEDYEANEEDVEISEFADVIDQWMLDELYKIGLETAKSVLAAGKDILVKRTELEEEQVDYILEVMRKEFED
ncbi:MAG: transcription termination factor NusA [Cytophagales bacterium]|nr:transcription termination factor NusA [Cytophagales bacterium]MDW8385143.1 transcription termination factor NusA [Flammeovirgaceae bacterium]